MDEIDVKKKLEEHDSRLVRLESSYESLKASQTETHLAVVKEGQATRALLEKFVDHTFDINKNRMTHKHNETMKILGIIGGSVTAGGVIYAIIVNLL